MATPQENRARFQEIANRGLQDRLDADKRARFDEAVRRGLITLPDQPSPKTEPALKTDPDSGPAPKEPELTGMQALEQKLLEVPGMKPLTELAAATNRSIFSMLDFFGPDQVNAALQYFGSDTRVPTLEGSLAEQPGAFMKEEGLGRDIVNATGEMIPAALGVGQLVRSAASSLPKMAAGESAATGTLRQMGSGTAKTDLQAASLAATGGEIGEEVGGAEGKLVGQALAPFTPAAATGLKESVKSSFRGSLDSKGVSQAVDDFAEVGATPTVGQASNKSPFQALETRASQVFGGGAISRQLDDTANKMQSRLGAIADDVSKVKGDVETGRVIQRGIIGDEGFVARFQGKSGDLWGKVDAQIPSDARAKVTASKAALDDLVRNDSFGEALNSPKLSQVKSIFDKVMGRSRINQVSQTREFINDISYKELVSLRRHIGERLGSKELISDVPRAQLKRLYAALSEDVKTVAQSYGAIKQFDRANKFTKAGHKRLDDFVERVANKVELNKVFDSIARGGEGTQALNAMKRSLKPEEWEAVGANVIRRLGKANPGQQDMTGEEFSVNKFLTDWNKLGPAKKVLFSGSPKLNEYSRNLDKIARVSERLKTTTKEGANPSGTGQLVANVSLGSGAVVSAVTGNNVALLGILGTVSINKGLSTLLTNKAFVRWLAQVPDTKNLQKHIARLATVAEGAGFSEQALELVQSLKQGSNE